MNLFINKNIGGRFSEHLGHCIYGGMSVSRDSDIPGVNGMRTDGTETLKNIKASVLRHYSFERKRKAL